MKSGKLRRSLEVVVFVAAMIAPLGVIYAYTFCDGIAGDESSLAIFGPDAQFVCEWVAGNQALMSTSSGRHRLVNTERPLRAGCKYKLTKPIPVLKAGYMGKVRLIEVS